MFRKIVLLCVLVTLVVVFYDFPVYAKHYFKYSSEIYRPRRAKGILQKSKRARKRVTKDRFRKFKTKYGKDCKAKWSSSGYIEQIYNILDTDIVSKGKSGVRKFLNENSELLGISEILSSFKLLKQSKTFGASRFVYGLEHNKVPIFGKRLYVNLCKANRVRMLSNEIPANIAFLDYEEHITMDDAIKIGAGLLSADNISFQDGKEVYFPEYSNVYSKVWMLSFKTSKPAGMWKIAVDKENGAIRWARNFAKSAVNGTGLVFDPNPITFHENQNIEDNNDADSELLSSALVSVTLKFLNDPINGRCVLSGPYTKIINPIASEIAPYDFLYSRSNDRFNEVMAYYHIQTFHEYITNLGFDILNDGPIKVDANGGSEDNSYYYPITNSITFGQGGVDDAEDADIIIHEYGHAILDNKVNLFGRNIESDTIGEAFGDYLACSYSAEKGFNPTYFAEWDSAPFGEYLRKIETSNIYPDDVDAQQHNDSTLLSSVLWELRTQTDKTTTDKLVIRAATNYITASATLQDFATGMLAADQELYGSIHSSMIINLFKARGIYGTLMSEEFEEISALPARGWFVWKTSSTSWNLSSFGDKNAFVRGSLTDVQDEWLFSPSFEFGKQPKLSFFWMRENSLTFPEQGAVLSVRVSTDGGETFGDSLFTLTESSGSVGKWNHKNIGLRSYANMNNVVIGFQYTGKGGDTMRIDNVAVVNSFVPPTLSITSPSGKKSGQLSLSFALSELENDTASVTVEYSTDSGATFRAAKLSDSGNITDGLSTSTSGISHTVTWDSVSDIGLTAQFVMFRLIPQYGGVSGRAVKTSVFIVDNTGNIPPEASVIIPSGKSGVISISFVLSDQESDNVIVGAEYSINGDSFSQATLLNNDSALATSPEGIGYTLFWDSLSDTGESVENVTVRIISDDGTNIGVPAPSESFPVDNTIPVPSSGGIGLTLLMLSFPLLLRNIRAKKHLEKLFYLF